MEYLIESLVALNLLVLGWLHMRQNSLSKRLDNCAPKDTTEEIKNDLREVVKLLTDVRVENAKWQGLMAKVIESDSKNS